MGLRGPLPRPENVKVVEPLVQEDIRPPKRLKAAERRIFLELVADNRAAGVPIRKADAALYADLASVTVRCEDASTDHDYLAYQRLMDSLRQQLCIGPRARARANIKAPAKTEAKSGMAAVLALAKKQ